MAVRQCAEQRIPLITPHLHHTVFLSMACWSGAWPTTPERLEAVQRALAEQAKREPAWRPPPDRPVRVGGIFIATPRGQTGTGAAGEAAWAAAAVLVEGRVADSAVVHGDLGAPYVPGLLALREGGLLEKAVRQLRQPPDVVLVNASGRDHPRRAGLALHLGAVCHLPSIGVTDRPLVGVALEPGHERGAAAELRLDDEVVGYRLRTRAGARAVVVHAGWRVDPDVARVLVLGQLSSRGRTPEALRQARRLARTARAQSVA